MLLALSPSLPFAAENDPPASAPQERSAVDKILMMHYMPWYETPSVRGQWGRHWTGHQSERDPEQTGEDGLPDIWSHFHPLIGLYDSTDPDALECHLLQMKLAGIDGVIVDWYGIGVTDDYPSIQESTRAMFDAAGRFGMKFAACFEDRSVELLIVRGKLQPEQVTDHLSQTMQWMQAEWFMQPHYFRVRGRPLLLNFGPIHVQDASVWAAAFEAVPERPAFFGLHHLWRKVEADGGFTWVHRDPWEGDPTKEKIRRRIREVFTYFSSNPDEVIVSAYPGFKDVYENPHPVLDHRGGETLRETLDVAMDGPWPLIQLITWNDYGEGTMMEPTHEFGYTFLEIIQEARREELGDVFPFTSDDLRLPARLYALRKGEAGARTTLDRIAGLLKDGACGAARRELDAVKSAQ